MLWVVFVIVSSSAYEYSKADSRLVHIEQGPVRGYKAHDGNFYVFYGVPYATAPTGADKYKSPLPPPIWSETLEAVDKHIVCPQVNINMIPESTMKEDCLTANIYVPATAEKKLPVVVYVHGGAYIIGYGNFNTPRHLVNSQKVIAVTFNYRLGAHGFLCLGTPDIPGNAGMKDQVTLLRWVKKNIAYFRGNPHDVTIAGYSAGSSSVDLLMISKITRGLFNKVIPESGANLAAFSVQRDPLENAKTYAKLLNFAVVDNIQTLEGFYKNATYEQLNSITFEILSRPDSTFLFSPCIERDNGVEIFLDDDPVSILKSGNYQKLPMLYGFTNMEGLFRMDLFNLWKKEMNDNFVDFLPADLQFANEVERRKVANKVKNFYFGEKYVSQDTVLDYVDYFTDVIFAYPTLRSVRMQVEAGNNKIYLYEYSFVDYDTPFVPYTNVRGADHCAQSIAVLDGVNMTHSDESIISEEYKKMKSVMRELWLNFISTGNPIHDKSPLAVWLPAGLSGAPYMSLNQTSKLMFRSLLHRRVVFWDDIYSKHYRYSIPPIANFK
ncbi:juvenile hormone esterase-like [Epargyreus clarus]|uniref:juvenile hormone esterase-like n=1 Tax=Epargyreus clarus TaxID=520877 RepID=UPI003C2B9A10